MVKQYILSKYIKTRGKSIPKHNKLKDDFHFLENKTM
ncbi:MAG: hypothetical protein ACI8ZM_003492 [Crocinitomix sp.]|jgi:hypothetical protein